MKSWSQRRHIFLAVASGLIYGVSLRLMFHRIHPLDKAHPVWFDRLYPNDLWVMTAGFLLFAPVAVGWLSLSSVPADRGYHWARWIFTPWLAILLSNVFVLLAGIEGVICIIFAIPITLFFSSLGGVAAGLVLRARTVSRGVSTVCVALFPLILAAVETQFSGPLDIRTVETTITITAPADVIWRNIERVPPIKPTELRPTWTHRIGFPLPVEATLDHERLGGIRHASFEHGLLFIETINAWQPQKRIAFSIAADTAHISPTTLDEHVTIGGRFFDVLDGEYRLEPRPDGTTVLHLSSHERLSTDFNRYAALWSDAIMRDLQESILEVVKHRCEQPASVATTRIP